MLAGGFPDVLQRMAEDIDWTEELGDAMLAQTDDLLDAVQRLRAQAAAAGNLESNEAQTVEVEGDEISIAPADPEVVYVPAYDAQTAYTTPGHASLRWFTTTPVCRTGSMLTTGAIAFGSALLVDEIFDDDDDWDDYWGRGRSTGTTTRSIRGRNVDIEGDVNIDRGDVRIGDGDIEKRREQRWEASRERRDEARPDIAERSDQRTEGRGERRGERGGRDRAERAGRASRRGRRRGGRGRGATGRAEAAPAAISGPRRRRS